jgi:hypothetical protein
MMNGDKRLMVVGHFNFVNGTTLPAEANAPLLVDADTMLALPIATQSLHGAIKKF